MLRALAAAIPLLAVLAASRPMPAQPAPPAPVPQLVLPGSHNASVTGLAAFSGNANWAASGSLDGTIVIWDVTSALPLRRITSDGASVSLLMLHPQGRAVVTEHVDGTVRFWDPSTGSLLAQPRALVRHTPLAYSPDGNTLYTSDGLLHAFRGVPSGSPAPAWTASPHSGGSYPRIVRALPDGERLLSMPSSGGEIAILSAKSGETMAVIRVAAKLITDIAVDSAGRSLAAATPDGVFLWDLSDTGSPRLALSPGKVVSEVLFNHDGNRLVARGPEEVLVYDALAGTLLRTIAVGFGQPNSMAVAGRSSLVTGSHTGTISVWDLDTGDLLRRSSNRLATVQSAHFGPDRRLAVAGVAGVAQPDDSFSGSIGKVWDFSLETASSLVYEGHVLSVVNNQFAGNGKYLFTSSFDGTRVWDSATLAPLASIRHQAARTAVSDDARYLVWQTMESQNAKDVTVLKIWSPAEGKERVAVRLPAESSPQLVAFHPGGELIATVSEPPLLVGEQPLWVNLIDPGKPSVQDRFQVPIERSTAATSLRFDADGGELVIGLADGRIVLCDYTHHRVRTILTGHSRRITTITGIPGGKGWASAADDGFVMVWEPGQQRPAQILRPASGYATMLQFDSRDELLLMGCWDGTVELWDWRQGRLLVSLALLDALRWVAATPEGLFDGSDGAWETLRWRFGSDTFQTAPVEQFFNEFFYPGLVGAILAGQRPVPRTLVGDIDRHAPEVGMDVAAASGQAGYADVRIHLREGLPRGGVRDVRLFRNGILVHAWRGQIIRRAGGTAEMTYRVPLGAGENRLEAYAFNNANIKSLTVHGQARGPATASPRIAYLLAIGVNRYADSSRNLEYARADAEEFLEQVRIHQTELDQFDRIEEKLLTDTETTHENIRSALSELARKGPP
jgi:WD40 repeat protein